MLQQGSEALFRTLATMFTAIIRGQSDMPEVWKQSLVTVIFKKGDATLPENYRPITLLRMMYELFAGILNCIISSYLEAVQSADQAGFRSGFGCDDNLFVITQLIEKFSEFQLPLWVCAIDVRKAFDTVEHTGIWKALSNQGVPPAYVHLLKGLYTNQVGRIITPVRSRDFPIERGTKQGDPMSPSIFNAVLEDIFDQVQPIWRRKGWESD